MNEPRRHHWWPEVHQRFWANEQKQVVCLDRTGKLFSAPPSKHAVIGDHNVFINPDGSKDFQPERILGKAIDDDIFSVVNKIRDLDLRQKVPALSRMTAPELHVRNGRIARFGFAPLVNFEYIFLTLEDRKKLAKYVASMIVRVPAFRQEVSATFNSFAEILTKLNKPIDRSESANQNYQIGVMLKNLPEFAKAIVRWPWAFVKAAPGETFVFSDNPVALNTPFGLGGGLSDLIFPILPNLILTAMDGPNNRLLEGNHVFEASPDGMLRFNGIAAGRSQDRIFLSCHPDEAFRTWLMGQFGVVQPKDIVVESDGNTLNVSMKDK